MGDSPSGDGRSSYRRCGNLVWESLCLAVTKFVWPPRGSGKQEERSTGDRFEYTRQRLQVAAMDVRSITGQTAPVQEGLWHQ